MKLIILDRDGVINFDSDAYIKSPQEWVAIPGSLQAIARLNQHGYRVAVATNQAGISRGLFDMKTLCAIHQKLHQSAQAVGARIDAIFYCPHAPDAHCDCRKPNPGMLLSIGQRFEVSLHNLPVVGDSLRDLQAAAQVGAAPYLVRTGNGEQTLAKSNLPPGTKIFDDLSNLVDRLLHAERAAPDTIDMARSALAKKK
ncbi:MAG: D-glycero-beta-D-manno-heptose 1,7-bisphosphate 7-phosphatase [Pseudomonadota bacterium]|jgi:D-glycero-D-manno-heptose 1,7-bisphosphate phosphatase